MGSAAAAAAHVAAPLAKPSHCGSDSCRHRGSSDAALAKSGISLMPVVFNLVCHSRCVWFAQSGVFGMSAVLRVVGYVQITLRLWTRVSWFGENRRCIVQRFLRLVSVALGHRCPF